MPFYDELLSYSYASSAPHFWPHYWPAAAACLRGPRSFFTGPPWGDGDRPIWKWTNGVRLQLSRLVRPFGLGPRICFWVKKKKTVLVACSHHLRAILFSAERAHKLTISLGSWGSIFYASIIPAERIVE